MTRNDKEFLTDEQLNIIRERIPEALTNDCVDYINKVMRAHTKNENFDARKDLLKAFDYVRSQAPEYGIHWGPNNLGSKAEISLIHPTAGLSGINYGLNIMTVIHELIHAAGYQAGFASADDDLSQTVDRLGIPIYRQDGKLMKYEPNPNNPKDFSYRWYWARGLDSACADLKDPRIK